MTQTMEYRSDNLWEFPLKKFFLLDYRLKYKNTKANSKSRWGGEGEKLRRGGRKEKKH